MQISSDPSQVSVHVLGHATTYRESPFIDELYVMESQEAFQAYCIKSLNFQPNQFPQINFAERKVIIIRKSYQGRSVTNLGLLSAQYDTRNKTIQLTTAFFGFLSCTNPQDTKLVLTIPKDWSFTVKHEPTSYTFEDFDPSISQLRRQANVCRIFDIGELDRKCQEVKSKFCGPYLLTSYRSKQ